MFKPKSNSNKYCKSCIVKKKTPSKTIVCCDCGEEFEVKSKANNKKRCNECQKEYIKKYDRKRKS